MRKLLERHRAEGNVFPLIGGHRGCICSHLENTIPAMEEGLRRGADYLEIDIQLTKDGIPVVFHDVEIETMTGLPGYIHDYTYSELRSAIGLETFEDVMRWGRRNDVNFALELKGMTAFTDKPNLDLIHPMIEVIRGTDMFDNTEAFGIDYRLLKLVKSIERKMDIGMIVPFIPTDPVELMKEFDAMIYLSYVFNLTPEMIRRLQGAGYFVSGAILRDMKLVDYAIESKVDMFEFDRPELIEKT